MIERIVQAGRRSVSLMGQPEWRARFALLAILAMALTLRVWGIGFGLPHLYHVDEGAVVMPALNILRTGDFNPHRFDYGSVHIYSLTGVYALYFLYGARAGIFQSVQDLPVSTDYHTIVTYPFPTIFLVGRLVSAVLGTLTVAWMYRVGARIGGKRTGLIAAALLAVLPEVVRHAHFIIPDVPMSLLVLVALEMILVAHDGRHVWSFVWAGLLTGLAASAKQIAIQLAPALLLAALVQRWPAAGRVKVSAVAILGVAAGYVIGTPYALLDLPSFLNWQAYDLRLYAGVGLGPIYEGPSGLWHLRYLLSGENAMPLMAAVIGAWLFIRKQPRQGVILVTFPVLHALSMTSQAVRYTRTWLPMAPFVCLFAAVAIGAVSDALTARIKRLADRRDRVTSLAALALVLPLLAGSVWIDIRLNEPDVRTRALNWIEHNLPPGSHLAVDLFWPPLSAEQWTLTRTLSLAQHDLGWYRSEGVEYLVLSEVMVTNPNRTLAEEERYQTIRQTCSPLAEISGPFVGPPERRIWIYRLDTCYG